MKGYQAFYALIDPAMNSYVIQVLGLVDGRLEQVRRIHASGKTVVPVIEELVAQYGDSLKSIEVDTYGIGHIHYQALRRVSSLVTGHPVGTEQR